MTSWIVLITTVLGAAPASSPLADCEVMRDRGGLQYKCADDLRALVLHVSGSRETGAKLFNERLDLLAGLDDTTTRKTERRVSGENADETWLGRGQAGGVSGS